MSIKHLLLFIIGLVVGNILGTIFAELLRSSVEKRRMKKWSK
jgi:uncharacterized membrane-anchored protein YhcB (DUF1043 family)